MENKDNLIKIEENSIKKIFVIFFSLFFLILILPNARANFVCGQVFDSFENVSSSWYDVRVYYLDKPENYSTCKVSPDENKYCCDAEAIPGTTWKVGQTIYSEVYNNETGYIAGPVSLVSSLEGYDVFPEMTLLKVIKIKSPIKKLIISKSSNVFFDLNILSPYNNIFIENNKESIFSCNNCSNLSNYFNLSFGMNDLNIIAKDDKKTFNEEISFGIVKDILYGFDIFCDNCKKNSVSWESNFSLKISLNLSDNISGFEMKEYIPIGFEILSSDFGTISSYSETHNVIVWNVSGKEIYKNIILKSPKFYPFNRKYEFILGLEDMNISNNEVIVNGVIPFTQIIQKPIFNSIKKKIYSKIKPNQALVLNMDKGDISKFGVIPNKQLKNVRFDLLSYKYKGKLNGVIDYYVFDTNIKNEDIKEFYVRFKVDKNYLKKKGYNNISLFLLNNQDYEKIYPNLLKQDRFTYYYEASMGPGTGLALVGE